MPPPPVQKLEPAYLVRLPDQKDISVSSDPKTMTAVWMGDLGLAAALSSRAIELEGRRQLERSFPKWFGLHPLFATVDHPTSRPRISA